MHHEAYLLQKHFQLLYRLLPEHKLTPHASFDAVSGVKRCLSGIPIPYNNALFGSPEDTNWDAFIHDQCAYFHSQKMPFVWYIQEGTHAEFRNRLTSLGFQDSGIFQGVIGALDKLPSTPETPKGARLELVTDTTAMAEFTDVMCAVFGIQGTAKELYNRFLWNAAKDEHYPMHHWIVRKEGKAVSTLTTLQDGEMVSFWNGATLPEFRRQGLSTSLRHLALRDAIARGCNTGASYLMSDGMALGICKKLGYAPKWRFHVLLAPAMKQRPLSYTELITL